MNLPFWSADAHVRSPLIRTWASGLQSLGDSRAEIAAVGGPWLLSQRERGGVRESGAPIKPPVFDPTISAAGISPAPPRAALAAFADFA
jgi:hypothetical protein